MLSVTNKQNFAECRHAECPYAECHDAKCQYSECHYAECRADWNEAYKRGLPNFVPPPALTKNIKLG